MSACAQKARRWRQPTRIVPAGPQAAARAPVTWQRSCLVAASTFGPGAGLRRLCVNLDEHKPSRPSRGCAQAVAPQRGFTIAP